MAEPSSPEIMAQRERERPRAAVTPPQQEDNGGHPGQIARAYVRIYVRYEEQRDQARADSRVFMQLDETEARDQALAMAKKAQERMNAVIETVQRRESQLVREWFPKMLKAQRVELDDLYNRVANAGANDEP